MPTLQAEGRVSALFFHAAGPATRPSRLTPKSAANASAPRQRPTPITDPAPGEFFRWLFGKLRLPIERYRQSALTRRLPACLRFLGVRTLADAQQRIEARPALALELMDVVLLGVSEFWRDSPVFADLRHEILPRMLRANPHPRIWSAACSEGQELYSVAALLAEADALERCELHGTDCRPEAIARARLGEFPLSAVSHLDASALKGLCAVQAGRARVHPRLRAAISWRVSDLLTQDEPGPWDLILWRNMAIYLEARAAGETWHRLIGQLAPAGFIVVGKADYPPATAKLRRIAPSIYAKAV